MGVAQKTRRNLIKKEVGVLFFIPAILPMIIMMFLIVGANQVFGEAILQENLFLTYGIVTLAVFAEFICYIIGLQPLFFNMQS